MVVVGGVEFNLHLSRLIEHCDLFSDLYRSDQVQEAEQNAAKASDADGIRSSHLISNGPVEQEKVSNARGSTRQVVGASAHTLTRFRKIRP